MLNIIRSQLYSIVHDIYTYVCGLIMMLILVFTLISGMTDIGSETLNGTLMFTCFGDSLFTVACFAVILFSTRLSGWDLNDKTINYEVLYGHKRGNIYWGRVLTAVVICTVITLLFFVVPIIAAYLSNGWGYSLPAKEGVIRSAISMLIMLRLSAVLILITVIVKNSWASMLLGYLMFLVESILAGIGDGPGLWTTVSSSYDMLLLENVMYDFINGKDVAVYQERLSGSDIALYTGVTAFAAIAALLLGYAIFRRRDMD